jgi:CheY-like chemotaxis protein
MSTKIEILIVDDSKFERSVTSNFFTSKDFIVREAADGQKCLEEIKLKKPDIILLDIEMPGLNGSEVLNMIRLDYNTLDLPVVMCTANAKVSKVVELLFLGANDYITKPIDFDIAFMRVMTQVRIGELSKEMGRLKEIESSNKLIAKYNHEINNPLAIAVGALRGFIKTKDESYLEKMDKALWRITDIVKQIDNVTKN